MKILYVCTTTDRGGAETALLRLVLAAQKQGHVVKVISLKPAGTVAAALQEAGAAVLSLNLKSKLNVVQAAGALEQLIQEVKTFQPDIVHAFLYRGIQFARMAKKYVPFFLITTPHYNIKHLSLGKKWIDRALKEADDISTAESQSTADFLRRKQRYKEEKICLITNGVDETVFSPQAEEREKYRKNKGFFDKNIVFCCVARLSKEKNHQTLIESFAVAYQHNPVLRLVLVGDGPEKENICKLIQQKHLEKVVSLTGELKDIRPILRGADVFVLVSLVESLPLSLLEAAACGLPALVSRTGDMPHIVQHGKTGFVCNTQDPVILSALMAELAENTALRKQMAQDARAFVLQNYPPSEEQFLKLYQNSK